MKRYKRFLKLQKRVALLATEATVQADIYQDGIAKRNIEYIHHETWQEMINQIITCIKSGEIEKSSRIVECARFTIERGS